MRDLAPEITALLGRRDGIDVRRLFWISAKNRDTGDMETIGISSELDHKQFVIDGDTRTYFGAGDFLSVNTLKTELGLTIRTLAVSASPFTTEMQTVLYQYEPKFAPIEMHLAFYDPLTNNMVAAPYRVFKGWIDTLPIKYPSKNSNEGNATINSVGHTRILTRTFPAKRSNETQKLRLDTDDFFSAVAITGTVITPWGTAQ